LLLTVLDGASLFFDSDIKIQCKYIGAKFEYH